MEERLVQMITSRLDRQESKLDSLTEAVTALARVEERLQSGSSHMTQLDATLAGLQQRVRTLEESTVQVGHHKELSERVYDLERLKWIFTGAVALAGMFGGLAGVGGGILLKPAMNALGGGG